MLITEEIEINGRKFIHNYSDSNKYVIRNDGVEYEDAIDLPDSGYTYTESDKEIPDVDEKVID